MSGLVVRTSLIDLYREENQSSEIPALTLETAEVTAVDQSGSPDPTIQVALGTVYQILQSEGTQALDTESVAFLSEAGLAVPEPSLYNILPVYKDSERSADTGVAIGVIALNTLNGYVQSSLPAGTKRP